MPLRLITLLGLLATAGMAQEDTPDAQVVELRALIGQIVEADALRSGEEADWQARKETMATLLDLHRRELALLDEELGQAGMSAAGHAERRDELEAKVGRLRTARDAVRKAVVTTRPRVLAIAGRLPTPLAREVAKDRATIEAWKDHQEPRPVLQAILSLVGAAEQFNRRVHRAAEVRDGREVEVLYLGLARAYSLDGSGDAGVGVPGPEGWTWKSAPDLAPALRNAFDQMDRKRPPALIGLPVRLPANNPSECSQSAGHGPRSDR